MGLALESYAGQESESILKARLWALFASGCHADVYAEIKSRVYPTHRHAELQDLWFRTHYAEVEAKRGKALGAVEKYRLRKKFPPPPTIWDGEETIYSFKENSRKSLKKAYKTNKYPSAEEKRAIAERTGLTFTQVTRTFPSPRLADCLCSLSLVRERLTNEFLALKRKLCSRPSRTRSVGEAFRFSPSG